MRIWIIIMNQQENWIPFDEEVMRTFLIIHISVAPLIQNVLSCSTDERSKLIFIIFQFTVDVLFPERPDVLKRPTAASNHLQPPGKVLTSASCLRHLFLHRTILLDSGPNREPRHVPQVRTSDPEEFSDCSWTHRGHVELRFPLQNQNLWRIHPHLHLVWTDCYWCDWYFLSRCFSWSSITSTSGLCSLKINLQEFCCWTDEQTFFCSGSVSDYITLYSSIE